MIAGSLCQEEYTTEFLKAAPPSTDCSHFSKREKWGTLTNRFFCRGC
jgi:hypothetical protein